MAEIIFFSVAPGSNWVVTDLYKVVIPCVLLIWFLTFQDYCYYSISTFSNLFRAALFLLHPLLSALKKASTALSNDDDDDDDDEENDKFFEEEEDCVPIMMERLMIFGEFKENATVLQLFDESEPSVAEIKEVFDAFDENGDGFIDESEVERILCRMGFSEFSQKDCRKMIMAYDENRDGKIDFREFLKLMEHSFG